MKNLNLQKMAYSLFCILGFSWISGCTFNIALTSQRTALENQIMGSYQDLDDEYILNASVRGADSNSIDKKHRMAQQNQKFNRDDIEEFKDGSIVGEASNGNLVVLDKADKSVLKSKPYLKQIVIEENRDRNVLWQHIIETNPNLSMQDLAKVRNSYSKLMIERARVGQWYQKEKDQWVQKIEISEKEPVN